MCHALLNNAFRHFGVGDAGRTVNQKGEEALFHEVDRFLLKPGVMEHLQRNRCEITLDIRTLALTDPGIAEKLVRKIEELDKDIADSIQSQILTRAQKGKTEMTKVG